MNSNDQDSVTESLYKQNLELAVKNKTLLLLRQLYQISISSLEPETLAEKIVGSVRETLELELVGILNISSKGDLIPMKFSNSERLKQIEVELSCNLESIEITDFTNKSIFDKISKEGLWYSENISEFWTDYNDKEKLQNLAEKSNVKTLCVYPMKIDGRVMGIFVICLNRPYDKLSQYEKESLDSLVDVAAVALDRAMLYQELKVANEKLKELDQMKSEFLSLATHQIRAPLTAIKGYSSMLLEGDFGVLPQKAKDSVGTIMKSCQNLIDIVGDFLNISRIEQGRMVYEKTVFDMGELVKEVSNELKPNIQNAHLEFEVEVPEGFVGEVNADRGKVKQVIGNIIDNSIKYTPKGGIKISVLTDANLVKVMVKDTGVGIDPAEMGKLFAKFSRTKDASKTNVIGTGLGLYIAKKMIEAHKGDIKVTSEGVGKGTTFTIELPKK